MKSNVQYVASYCGNGSENLARIKIFLKYRANSHSMADARQIVALISAKLKVVGSFFRGGAWRRGECPGSTDRGTMFESCRGCDIADLFNFDASNEGPPWESRMSL